MPFLDKFRRARPSSSTDFSESARTPQIVSLEGAMNLEAQIQEPVEDGAIMNSLIALRSHIEAHTITTAFYHWKSVDVDKDELEKHIEHNVLKNTAESAATLTSILLEPNSRATGIRIVIARILLANIDFYGDPQQTLLSPAAVSLMTTFRSKGWSDESQEGEADATILAEGLSLRKEGYQLALARWRVLSTFLLPADKNGHFEASSIRARGIIASIDCILMHLIDGQYTSGTGKEEREDNLATIISCAAKLGNMLFSQPTTWEFCWDMPTDPPRKTSTEYLERTTTRQEGFVVYPAIWKTSDLDGRILPKAVLKDSPQIALSPTTISSTVMDIREDTDHARLNLQKKATVRLREGAAVAAAQTEKPCEQSNDTGKASRDVAGRQDNTPSKATGVERLYKQQLPSNKSSPSDRETKIFACKSEVSRSGKGVRPGSQAPRSNVDEHHFDKLSVQEQTMAEPIEIVPSNLEEFQRSHQQPPQRNSAANEIEPRPTTDAARPVSTRRFRMSTKDYN